MNRYNPEVIEEIISATHSGVRKYKKRARMVKENNGKYITYKDHKKELEELQNDIIGEKK